MTQDFKHRLKQNEKNWKGWTITIDEGELRFFLSLWISLVLKKPGRYQHLRFLRARCLILPMEERSVDIKPSLLPTEQEKKKSMELSNPLSFFAAFEFTSTKVNPSNKVF